jgi:hypothetical protein
MIMKMKTTLLYRLKESVRVLFGVNGRTNDYNTINALFGIKSQQSPTITVKTDLLNHNVDGKNKEMLIKSFAKELIDEFQSGDNSLQSVKEQFQTLPFSRISEEAMVEIIGIVRLDIGRQNAQNLRKYANIIEQLENDMKQRAN